MDLQDIHLQDGGDKAHIASAAEEQLAFQKDKDQMQAVQILSTRRERDDIMMTEIFDGTPMQTDRKLI